MLFLHILSSVFSHRSRKAWCVLLKSMTDVKSEFWEQFVNRICELKTTTLSLSRSRSLCFLPECKLWKMPCCCYLCLLNVAWTYLIRWESFFPEGAEKCCRLTGHMLQVWGWSNRPKRKTKLAVKVTHDSHKFRGDLSFQLSQFV